MRFLELLGTICLTLFYVLPTLAVTEGKAWVNFLKDCPNEVVKIEEITLISLWNQSSNTRQKGVASPTASSSFSRVAFSSSSASIIRFPSPSSFSIRAADLLSSASTLPRSSSSFIPNIPLSTSVSTSPIVSKISKFRSALAARKTEDTAILSPAVNITQGQCVPVPIVTSAHIDSRSISVEAELSNVTPFQDCNITVHEVPRCIDPPLIVAPVNNRKAESVCKRRNFDAFSDVWIMLDCSEVGTGTTRFKPSQSMIPRTKPTRRVFHDGRSHCTFPNFTCSGPSDP